MCGKLNIEFGFDFATRRAQLCRSSTTSLDKGPAVLNLLTFVCCRARSIPPPSQASHQSAQTARVLERARLHAISKVATMALVCNLAIRKCAQKAAKEMSPGVAICIVPGPLKEQMENSQRSTCRRRHVFAKKLGIDAPMPHRLQKHDSLPIPTVSQRPVSKIMYCCLSSGCSCVYDIKAKPNLQCCMFSAVGNETRLSHILSMDVIASTLSSFFVLRRPAYTSAGAPCRQAKDQQRCPSKCHTKSNVLLAYLSAEVPNDVR